MKMALPERKSQKLEMSILKFKKNLNEFKLKYKALSEKILNSTSKLLDPKREEKTKVMETIIDLHYEMENDILPNIEMILEDIGGAEIEVVDVDSYLSSIKEEQDILKHLELSAKNLIKTVSVQDNNLITQEKDNLQFLHDSYKKQIAKTQKSLEEIRKTLDAGLQKVKKMEKI